MTPEQLAEWINQRISDEAPEGSRLDASDTAVLFRKLEHVKSRTYDVVYPELKARSFIPVESDADPAAQTIVYQQWDAYGMAKVVSNYGTDFPRVDVVAKEFRTPVKSVGASYGYSVMDLRASRLAGGPSLDSARAAMAKRAIETKLDYIAAYGDPTGLGGLLVNANVPETAAVNGTWISSNRTAVQMLEDLHAWVAASVLAGKDVYMPDTVVLPTAEYIRVSQKFMDNTNQKTVLRAFLDENPWIRNVDYWSRNDAVPVVGSSARKLVLIYTRNAEVLTLEMPQEFEQFPPQPKGMEFEVYCHARTGGVVIRYPIAVRYGTGI